MKINKRKRRRYKNSFLNSSNLVIWADSELNNNKVKNMYSGPTLNYFDGRERQMAHFAF